MKKVNRRQWTDEKIKEEILNVKRALMLNRMPSRSEIELVTRNAALTNKISKRIDSC